MTNDGFKITAGRGFHFTYRGITLSVQFGGGNYCANYNMEIGSERKSYSIESPNAEIALFDANGHWITRQVVAKVLHEKHGDDVMGYVTPEQIAKIISWMKNRKAAKKDA